MNVHDEIKGILAPLLEKGRISGADCEKLLRLFDQSGLELPEHILRRDIDPAALLAAWRRREGKASRMRPRFAAPWILFPAAAAAALIVTAMIRFFFFVPDTTGQVLYVVNRVQAAGSDGTRVLHEGDTIRPGETVHTGAGGKADIGFSDGITVRLGERSDFSPTAVSWGAGSGVFDAVLTGGTAIVCAKKSGPGDTIILRTPFSEALVKGTLFSITVEKDSASSFRTYEGAIRVRYRIDGEPAMRDDERLLRSRIDSTAVTVGEGERCHVAPLTGAGDGTRREVPALTPLVAEEIGGSDDELSREVRDFMSRTAGRADLVTGQFLVFPPEADLIVDGKRKASPGRVFFLDRGRHDVTISAPGYEAKRANITVDPDTAFVFVLARRGEREMQFQGRGGIGSLHEPKTGTGISFGAQGTIKGTVRGTDRWLLHLNSSVRSRPVLDSGSLYLATAEGGLMRIDAASGSIIWSVATGLIDEKAGIAVRPGGVFTVSESALFRRHHDTGGRIWKRGIGGAAAAAPVFLRGKVYLPVAASVISIDEETGARTWKRDLDSEITFMAGTGSGICLGTVGGGVYTIDPSTGEMAAREGAGDAVTAIAAEDSTFFVLTGGGVLLKYGIGGAAPLWRIQTPLSGLAEMKPAGSCISLIEGDNACLYDISSGTLRWRVVFPRGMAGQFQLRGNTLSFVDHAGNVTNAAF
jgi:hypothetical protein